MASKRRTLIQPISIPPHIYEILRKKGNISRFVCSCILYYEENHRDLKGYKRELERKARELAKQLYSLQEKIRKIEEEIEKDQKEGGEIHDETRESV